MRITHWGRVQTYRNLRRVFKISAVSLQCCWLWIREYRALRRSVFAEQELVFARRSASGKALRYGCEKLGPAFVKLGQILSTRSDLLPVEITSQLAQLQDRVAPIEFHEIVTLVEREYDTSLNHHFAEFNPVPLGAASLSQVHEAKLTSTGESVVVKVQRPNIRAVVDTDMALISLFIPLLERIVMELRHLNLRSAIREFHKTICMEMDFTREMHNALKFAKIFVQSPDVRIPVVCRKLCTPQILVMEKLEGIKIDQLQQLDQLGYNRGQLAQKIIKILSTQAFTHSIYNGDVHAGNIIVMPGGVIGMYDFGMVRTIDQATQRLMTDLFMGAVAKDSMRISKILAGYTEKHHQVNVPALARDIHELLTFYHDLPAEDLQVDTLFEAAMDLCATYRLIMPQELIMLCRATVMAESMLRMLNPELSFITSFAPVVKDAIKQRFSLHSVLGEITRFSADGARALQLLPSAAAALLSSLSEGAIRIDSHNQVLEQEVKHVQQATTTLAWSIFSGLLALATTLALFLIPPGSPGALWITRILLPIVILLVLVTIWKLLRALR